LQSSLQSILLFILLSCFFVSWSFVLCFAFPAFEFSVAGWRSVNLALPFLNHENGDFLILMRDIYLLMVQSSLQLILIFLSFFLCRCLTNVSCRPIPSPGFVNYERKSHSKICIVASKCNFKECLFSLLCTKLMT
jgi:hypothetical protein